MGEGQKPTETGGGDAIRQIVGRSDKQRHAAYLVIDSGVSLLQAAGVDRFNLRRILDGVAAMTAAPPPRDAPAEALQAYRDTLALGIAALQSTDDLGPELNDQLWLDQGELQVRLAAIDARLEP